MKRRGSLLFCWVDFEGLVKYAVHVWYPPCQTTTPTAWTPEGNGKNTTASIFIQGLWIRDIHFLRELETRVRLKYTVHVWDQPRQTTTSTASIPEGSSKKHNSFNFYSRLVDLRHTFPEGARDEGLVKICGPRLGSAPPDNNLNGLDSRRKQQKYNSFNFYSRFVDLRHTFSEGA